MREIKLSSFIFDLKKGMLLDSGKEERGKTHLWKAPCHVLIRIVFEGTVNVT